MFELQQSHTAHSIQPRRQALNLALRFFAGILVAISLALALFVVAMRPPLDEFRAMTLFLSATALVSLGAGYALYRLGWVDRYASLHWSLVTSYVLSSALTFVNVWVTARLMFINQHDLTLATILLVFAAGIAVALGSFFAASLTDRIRAVNSGARAIAAGDLDVRVVVTGNDEVAELSESFNRMARQLQSAAKRQQELEDLRRELIAWVGHDLRTPLASVRAIIEALADEVVEDDAARRRYLRIAQKDIGALATLIDDLFEMAQLDAGGLKLERQANSLSDLISDTLETFSKDAADRGINLTGAVAPETDPAVFDPRHLGRVLNNLVSNALRHTPQGGNVRITAGRGKNEVWVEIADSGEGINPEDAPYVFEKFYRAEKSRSRSTGGSGLGLAIAKGLIEAHGGHIWLESEPKQGTSVKFVIPQPVTRSSGNPLLGSRRMSPGQIGDGG